MEVITLHNNAFKEDSLKLISKLKLKPDLVLGVLTGGGYLLEVVKNDPQLKNSLFKSVTLQRKSTSIKKRFFKKVLPLLPYLILNWLRIKESKQVEKKIHKLNVNALKNKRVDFSFNEIQIKGIKNILIIDDALDTGKTMFIVKNNLQHWFPNAKIEIAVIAWTIEASIVKPDYYLYKKKLVRFPWSNDYKR